jgi:hypothetical protein
VAPLDVSIGLFTSRTYAVATLAFRATGLLLHQPLGRYFNGGASGEQAEDHEPGSDQGKEDEQVPENFHR